MRTALLCSLLLTCGTASAEESKPPATFQMLVLADARTSKEAEAALKKSKPLFTKLVHASEGFPKVAPSESFEGLPPKRFLVVAGFCAQKGDADVLHDLLVASGVRDATMKTVSGAYDGLCPSIETIKPTDDAGWVSDRSGWVAKGAPSFKWELFGKHEKDSLCYSALVRFTAGTSVVAEAVFLKQCVPAADGKGCDKEVCFDPELHVGQRPEKLRVVQFTAGSLEEIDWDLGWKNGEITRTQRRVVEDDPQEGD